MNEEMKNNIITNTQKGLNFFVITLAIEYLE